MTTRSLLLSQLLMFFFVASLQAQLPFLYDAGYGGECPVGADDFTRFPSVLISNTIHDALYQHECSAPGVFQYPLKVGGMKPGETYSLYLHFAEIFFGPDNPGGGGLGSRVFSVEVNGFSILKNLDIFQAVGANTALVYRYDATADADTIIWLQFETLVGRSALAALELRQQGQASAFPPISGVIDLNSVFPVEWLSFDGRALPTGAATLEWATGVEINNAGFRVEMAADGLLFETLGFVPAGSMEGDTYQFTTPSLREGRYLFRLAQMDLDGAVNYSPLVEVSIAVGAWRGMVITSADGPLLRVEGMSPAPLTATVLSIQGQRMGAYDFSTGKEWALNSESFPAGVYVVSFSDGHMVQSLKFSIQR